jgi:hypothetical protein
MFKTYAFDTEMNIVGNYSLKTFHINQYGLNGSQFI